MSEEKRDWRYMDDQTGALVGPLTQAELDGLHSEGRINDFTQCTNTQMMRRSPEIGGPLFVMYSMISRRNVTFSPSVNELHSDRTSKSITVFCGPNNGGKTLLLKELFYLIGHDGYLISCNRFSHVDLLNTRHLDNHEYRNYYDNFVHNYHTSKQNTENNERQLDQIITGLTDSQRTTLFRVAADLLGNEFNLKRTNPENQFSPYYVDMDGENLRYGSSGTRLLLTLLGQLLDRRFSVILVDEPEIGLSPRLQASLARFLYNEDKRNFLCPHLRQIYIATHSHLFLDRGVLSNNYVVTKSGAVVSVRQIHSFADLHQLQFNMLGNELESLFLPSAIVIVEGESERLLMSKVIRLRVPDRNVAIVRADGDGEMMSKLNVLKEAFGDLTASPFRDRLFVVLDKSNSVSTSRIEKQGLPKDNIVVWSKNGIEHFYPKHLVAKAFSCDESELASADLESDPIEINGCRKSKVKLAQFVTDEITITDEFEPEVEGLFRRIRAACGALCP